MGHKVKNPCFPMVPEDDCYFTTSKDTRTKNCMRDVKTTVIIACIENNFIVLNTMIITKYPNQLKLNAWGEPVRWNHGQHINWAK